MIGVKEKRVILTFTYRKQGVVLYIFFLPFSLVESLGLLVIPVVALVSFTLFGIIAIGHEIENPCKYTLFCVGYTVLTPLS